LMLEPVTSTRCIGASWAQAFPVTASTASEIEDRTKVGASVRTDLRAWFMKLSPEIFFD
jgi:hypothetical protein